MLRRLEKRIIVDLPNVMARKAMFEHYLPPDITNKSNSFKMTADINYEFLAEVRCTLRYQFVALYINFGPPSGSGFYNSPSTGI